MLIVQKFGGSSVANKERIFNVAKRIIDTYKAGNDVVVVLSAQGDTTDELIDFYEKFYYHNDRTIINFTNKKKRRLWLWQRRI